MGKSQRRVEEGGFEGDGGELSSKEERKGLPKFQEIIQTKK
jgi:hypothetical protein